MPCLCRATSVRCVCTCPSTPSAQRWCTGVHSCSPASWQSLRPRCVLRLNDADNQTSNLAKRKQVHIQHALYCVLATRAQGRPKQSHHHTLIRFSQYSSPMHHSSSVLHPATHFYCPLGSWPWVPWVPWAHCYGRPRLPSMLPLCSLQLAMGASRSAAFLSLYVALAFGAACGGFNASQSNTGAIIAASVWAGGLATFVVKKSRRWEAEGAHV